LYPYEGEILKLRLEATRSPRKNRHRRRQYGKYDKLLINIRSNPLKEKRKKVREIEYQIATEKKSYEKE